MKKILFAAVALVAFAACTNDDVVSRLEGPAIAFDNAFVENTTRVAQDLSKANLNNFGVYGSVENASGLGMIFTNTTVTKNGDAYTYSPAQYWVGDATYNFTAFAPAADQKWAYNTLDAKNGVVTFDNEAAAGKQDFLFASANETTPSAITSAPAPVAFTFNHMLSRVKFSFTNGFAAGSNIALKVTDVKITNAHKSGDLEVVNGVAQEWVVADNAVATNAFERPFGNLSAETLAENGGNGETTHYYLIPANAEYTVTFNVEIFQAGVSVHSYARQAVVSLDMEKGCSYNVKATLNEKNTSADGELYSIEFTVDAVEDWAEYVTTPLGWDGVTVSEPAYNNATATYTVASATELAWLAAAVNGTVTRSVNTFEGQTIVLSNDIDLQNFQWAPIGYWQTFEGTFDGQGHTISNLTHVATELDCYIGLFGCTKNATIKNVKLHNVNIKLVGDNSWAGGHIGALVGYPDGATLIENVDVTGFVRIEGDIIKKGAQRIGGVVGGYTCKSLEMKNVSVNVEAGSYVKGNLFVGGVAGSPLGKVKMTNVESNINVIAQEGIVGGIIGYTEGGSEFIDVESSGNVTRLHTAADATQAQWLRIGGIIGSWGSSDNTVTTLTGCEYTGTLSAVNNSQKPFDFWYGGLVGGAYFEGTPGNGKLVINGEEQAMPKYVKTAEELANAFAGNYACIVLAADIINTEASFKVANDAVLDLAGHTISGNDQKTGSYALIEVQPTKSLNIINTAATAGKLSAVSANNRGWNAYSSVVSNQRGTLTVGEGVVIEHLGGTDMAYAIDNLTNTGNQKAVTTIDGATVKSTYRAIRQFLNSTANGVNNELYVNSGVIEGANKSIWMQNANSGANPGKLVVEAAAQLNGNVLISGSGATTFPVEVSIAEAALVGESMVATSNVPADYVVALENGVYVNVD